MSGKGGQMPKVDISGEVSARTFPKRGTVLQQCSWWHPHDWDSGGRINLLYTLIHKHMSRHQLLLLDIYRRPLSSACLRRDNSARVWPQLLGNTLRLSEQDKISWWLFIHQHYIHTWRVVAINGGRVCVRDWSIADLLHMHVQFHWKTKVQWVPRS